MADQSDVENALAALVSAALYPTATGAGTLYRVYRGWPNAAALDADLAAGVLNVSIYPADDERNTTRYFDQWIVPVTVTATLSASVSGNVVSFAGTAGAGQLAGVLADNAGYVYRTQAGDTPALVAANLAVLIRADRIATLSGVTVTVPGAERLVGRVVADQDGLQQTRRQMQGFRISIWCPDYATRDATATAIDVALSQQRFITLADGSRGQLIFQRSQVVDRAEDAGLFRRDLLYSVEYPTTLRQSLPSMLFGDLTLGNGANPIINVLS
ncbi:MAG: hypothetical protein JO264_13325 [Acidisphaera sp.]|nr:hypothetical protein [Acidisphaera sp.]